MILKKSNKRSPLGPILWSVPFLIVFGLLAYNGQSIDVESANDAQNTITLFSCDLESIDGSYFDCGDQKLEGAKFITSVESRSGANSIALNSSNIYGLTTVFSPDAQDYTATYHVSVWRYNPNNVDSWLVVTAEDPKDLYLTIKEPVEKENSGWEQLHIVFQLGENYDAVKIYCYAGGDGKDVYFDDFVLEQINLERVRDKYEIPRIDLEISDASFRKLQMKRDEAWKRGLLVSSDDDWVDARVTADGNEMDGKVRLKGDWVDHLKGNKWSFRVDLKDEYALWGMTTFNLQRPETRGFLNEWLYHKLLEEQDILSPRYTFVLISLNNEILGFYACEEHFMKELVESRSRREGPILKFTEDRFWDGIARQFDSLGISNFVFPDDKKTGLEVASIRPFKEKKYTEEGSTLQDHYHRGAYLMYLYKNGLAKPSDIFDVVLLGKYLAIVDITGAYHNLTWHNQRWYYNPLSDKLEPIGYDGFTGKTPMLHPGSLLSSDEVYFDRTDSYEPYRQFFYDEKVVSVYLQTLDSLTKSARIDQIFDRYGAEMATYESIFSEEYFYFAFDSSWFKNHNTAIRLSLPAFENSSLLATLDGNILSLRNIHKFPLVVKIPDPNGQIRSEVVFPDHNHQNVKEVTLAWPIKELAYSVLGFDKDYLVSVDPLGHSRLVSDSVSFAGNHFDHASAVVNGQEVFIRSGKITESLRIPSGYRVHITEGSNIDLLDHSYILSESPVFINGTSEAPVYIHSSDRTGAIMVRKTDVESTLKHTLFRDLARINDKGFSLTGGVTFYEADLKVYDCSFKNSQEEDALNIVRSRFTLADVVFDSTAFDAFDADFCVGEINGGHFQNTGNDAIDFSGSIVNIRDVHMYNIGDKGISVGEASDVHLYSGWVNGAVIGVASKDLSNLEIDFISLANVGTGFTVFQKKSTFGPAEIIVHKHEMENVKRPFLVEEGSSLTFTTENSL